MQSDINKEDYGGLTLEYFDEIVVQYEKAVVQFAYTYVKDWSLAEDISQDVFIKIYKNLKRFEQRSELKTWIFSITANHCKDYLRSTKRKTAWWNDIVHVFQKQSIESPESILIQDESNKSLGEDLLSLPIKYREILVLFYYEDLNTEEISKLLKVNASTVRTRLERGRNQLKAVREGGYDHEK